MNQPNISTIAAHDSTTVLDIHEPILYSTKYQPVISKSFITTNRHHLNMILVLRISGITRGALEWGTPKLVIWVCHGP